MLFLSAAALASTVTLASAASFVNRTTCNKQTYTYEELAGYGSYPSDARDKYGDTMGGIGSSIYIDKSKWKKLSNGGYSGEIWALPDRGWNTEGTANTPPRIHKLSIVFTPNPKATVANPSGPNLLFTYLDTILFTGPDDQLCTGLDADGSGHLSYPGFPNLPAATFAGDGFGGDGPGGKAIAIDAEGLVVSKDGSFWVSEEYGPYIYHFDPAGKMIGAIRPHDAIIPRRNGSESFSSDSPPRYINNGAGDDVIPAHPVTGRENNHGFEGLTISPNGKTLYVLLQAAATQEGGLKKTTERYVRFLKYDISNPKKIKYEAEYVVPLPLYKDPSSTTTKKLLVAAQSEIHYINDDQFFILARDSGAGAAQPSTLSTYRHVDIFDIKGATNIKGSKYDCATCAIASKAGALDPAIKPATYCSFLDFNINEQLNRFGVRNGGVQDPIFLLNEKWESLGLVPVDGKDGENGEYFLFSMSDNDFVTQNGFLGFGQYQYHDASGYNLNNQALVFKIKLPRGTDSY